MADSRSQMGFGHNMAQQGGQPSGFNQNQYNMMQQQQQQQYNNMMANQQMMQQANPMLMQQHLQQQQNAMMQQQAAQAAGMSQGMPQQFQQAMFPGQVPQQMPMGMYMLQQGQYGGQRFAQPGMPVQNIAPPAYTPQMAQEFKHKSDKFAARQARQLEEQRKKLEAEHRARMFQEQQKRLKEFSAIGGRKIDADSMIKNIIGPERTSRAPPGATHQHHPHAPPPASTPVKDADDDGDFGDFITGPSVQSFPTTSTTTNPQQLPSTNHHQASSQQAKPSPVQSTAAPPMQGKASPIPSSALPPTSQSPPTFQQAPPTSQPQAPPISSVPITKEEKKDLEKMMFASCDLTNPQKARTFEKRTLVKDAPKQVRQVTYKSSQKARAWECDTEKLNELFVLPGTQEQKPVEGSSDVNGMAPQQMDHSPGGQSPGGVAPTGQAAAPQAPTAATGGQQPAGPIPQGLPVWCMGEMPVPDIYMMVLQASLREGKIETELVYPILVRSGLPREVLRTIWEMSNKTVPGQLMPQELCAALALIAVAQSTMTVPTPDVLHRLPGPPIPNLGQGTAAPAPDSNASSMPQQVAPQAHPPPPHPGGATSQPMPPPGERMPNLPQSGAAGASGMEDDFDDFQEAPTGVPPSDSFGDFIVASPVNASVGLPGAVTPSQEAPVTERKNPAAATLMGDEDKYGAFRALAEDGDTNLSSDLFSGPEPGDPDASIFKKMAPPPLSSHAHPPQELITKVHPTTSTPQVAAFMGQPVKDDFDEFKVASPGSDDFADFQSSSAAVSLNNSSNASSGGGSGLDRIAALKALVQDNKLYEVKSQAEPTDDINDSVAMDTTSKEDGEWDPFGSLRRAQDNNKSDDMIGGGLEGSSAMDTGMPSGHSSSTGAIFSKMPPTQTVFGIKPEAKPQKDLFPENEEEEDSWGGFKESGTTQVKSNWADFSTSAQSSSTDLASSSSATKMDTAKWTLPQPNDWALSSSKNESDLTTFGNFPPPTISPSSSFPSQKLSQNELKPKREPKPMSTTPKKFNYFARNLEAMSSGVSAGTGMSALDFEPPELPDVNDNEDDDDFDKFGTFDSDANIAVNNSGGLSSLGAPYGMDDITETGANPTVDMFGYSSRPRTHTQQPSQPQKDTSDSVSISSNEFTGWKVPAGKSSKESDSQSVSSLDLTTLKQNKSSSKDGSPVGGDSQSVSSLEFGGGVDRKSITPADERSVASLELKAASTPDDSSLDASISNNAATLSSAVAQNGFGEFSSATDGPNTMFRTANNLDYIQKPRAASELLATGDLPSIGDRYSSLVQKQEAGDEHVTEWVRCLDKCRGMLEEAAHTFTSINDPTLCEEVLHSQQGTAYIEGVVEVYRVVCRITEAMRAVSATNEKLVQLLKSIDTAWLDLVTLLSDTPLKPSPGKLDFSGAVLKAEEDGAQDRACGVCLLNVDAKSKRSSPSDGHKLTYGGRQYHASCANFWVNCVASMLPALKIPELL